MEPRAFDDLSRALARDMPRRAATRAVFEKVVPVDKVRILVATEPRLYREVMAATVREFRPGYEVTVAEPAGLDEDIARLRPHFVLCSRLARFAQVPALAWAMLYPNGEKRIVLHRDGERETLPDIEFLDLLAIVDQRAGLAASGAPSGAISGTAPTFRDAPVRSPAGRLDSAAGG